MFDLAIVGAGPAGLQAALTAAEGGLSVVVVDEQQRPGGQIFRQPPRQFAEEQLEPPRAYRWGRELVGRSEAASGIEWRMGSTAFGVLRDSDSDGDDERESLSLAVNGPAGADVIGARRILVATGALDMPVPFPGWTLPGVITAGGVQTLVKSQKLLYAHHVVLAGSHPLLLVVAEQLVANGAQVVEVAVSRRPPTMSETVRALPAIPGHLSLLAESAAAMARLIRAGVKVSTRTVVTSAHGRDRVQSVTLAAVDDHWLRTGRSREVSTEAVVIGYGFQPSTELARQAGCAVQWRSDEGGWVVVHDRRMRTTAPGIYVAGEPTGVGGAEQSRAEGHLAGLSITTDLRGPASRSSAEIAAAARALRRASRFSRVVQRTFAPQRLALADLAQPDTVLCRCELVTRRDVDEALAANPFLSTANAVKLECRIGMGLCQGRYCETTTSQLIKNSRGLSTEQVGAFSAQMPVKPVPLAALTVLDRASDAIHSASSPPDHAER